MREKSSTKWGQEWGEGIYIFIMGLPPLPLKCERAFLFQSFLLLFLHALFHLKYKNIGKAK